MAKAVISATPIDSRNHYIVIVPHTPYGHPVRITIGPVIGPSSGSKQDARSITQAHDVTFKS